MATLVVETAEATTPAPQRKLWTVAECERMITAGIDLERYQLIDGELIAKMSKGDPHNDLVTLLAEVLRSVFGRLRVREEKPIRIPDIANLPEPDITVVNHDPDGKKPWPGDILLLVEVSDSTLREDLGRKAMMYAKAGIADYWVLDVEGRSLIVHRGPDPIYGIYNHVTTYREDEPAAPLASPDTAVALKDILPGRQESAL